MIYFIACRTPEKSIVQSNSIKEFVPDYSIGPPTIVYKTNADYSKNVPVILSDDKTTVVSYPHPSDVKIGNGFPYPTILSNGYLMDNRGISKNVAFLKLTYEEYSKLKNPLSLKDMYDLIIDKNPVTEMYDCGNKQAFTSLTEQLNGLIKNNQLKTKCKVLKGM